VCSSRHGATSHHYVGVQILLQLGGIDVDPDHSAGGPQCAAPQVGIPELGADGQHHVTLIDVALRGSRHDRGAERERVALGDDPLSVHGRYGRHLQVLDEPSRRRCCPPRSTAKDEDATRSRAQRLRGPLDLELERGRDRSVRPSDSVDISGLI
jgi:hypothetical protein